MKLLEVIGKENVWLEEPVDEINQVESCGWKVYNQQSNAFQLLCYQQYYIKKYILIN